MLVLLLVRSQPSIWAQLASYLTEGEIEAKPSLLILLRNTLSISPFLSHPFYLTLSISPKVR
jgi:hypothetical protein